MTPADIIKKVVKEYHSLQGKYPSQSEIARKIGETRQHVNYHLKRYLLPAGWTLEHDTSTKEITTNITRVIPPK